MSSHESLHQASDTSYSLPLPVTKVTLLHAIGPHVHYFVKLTCVVWYAGQRYVFSRQAQHNDNERAMRVTFHKLDQTTTIQCYMLRVMNEYDD